MSKEPSTPLPEYGDERDEERFWHEVRPRQEPVRRRWFLPSVAVLLIFNIPWYLPGRVAERMVGGLPLWTWIALLTSALLATLTAFVALRAWQDDD